MVYITMVLSVVFNVVIYHVTMVISEAVILNLSVTMVAIFYFCKSDESLVDYGVCKLLHLSCTARLSAWYPLNAKLSGTRDAPPAKFLLLSCSFRQKSCQIIGFHSKLEVDTPVWEILDPPLMKELFAAFYPFSVDSSHSKGSYIFGKEAILQWDISYAAASHTFIVHSHRTGTRYVSVERANGRYSETNSLVIEDVRKTGVPLYYCLLLTYSIIVNM